MINKFARNASNYSYYGYLNLYTPQQLRTNQSDRHYTLGRRGAYNNLVLKMAADHINYEEDFNLRYKTPPIIVKFSYRMGIFFFIISVYYLSFKLGDMTKSLRPKEFYYPTRPNTNGRQLKFYQTMYIIDQLPRY